MPWHHVSDDTYRTLVDELTRVARSATRERAELALEALADLDERE